MFVIRNYGIFVPNFSTLELFIALIIFGDFVAYKVFHWVFTFNFYYDMPQQSPVGDILHPDDQVKDFEVVRSFGLWDND